MDLKDRSLERERTGKESFQIFEMGSSSRKVPDDAFKAARASNDERPKSYLKRKFFRCVSLVVSLSLASSLGAKRFRLFVVTFRIREKMDFLYPSSVPSLKKIFL